MSIKYHLQQLYNQRELLYVWTSRTLKARYQQSILGALWAIVQPAASVAILTVLFTWFIPVDTGGIPYAVFSYTAMVPWTLFSNSVSDMVGSLVDNMNLVTKIYFPREILPISSLLARLVDAGIASLVLLFLMLYFDQPFFPVGWLYLPFILLIQLALSIGVGLVGAALNVYYRDTKHLFTLGLQIWFYATPIIYPIASVPERFRSIYFLNPMAGVIEAYRAILLYQKLPGSYLVYSGVISIAVFIGGYWLFKRLEFQFADIV